MQATVVGAGPPPAAPRARSRTGTARARRHAHAIGSGNAGKAPRTRRIRMTAYCWRQMLAARCCWGFKLPSCNLIFEDSDLGLANVSHAGDIFETPALPVRAADWLALLSWPAGYVYTV